MSAEVKTSINREEWLNRLSEKMHPMFAEIGEAIPEKIRFTCGWPSKGAFSSKRRTVGECWLKGSKDNHVEVFVSPCVSDSIEVGAILAHELVHACGHKGHGSAFKRVAVAIGLEGPMRATKAGSALADRLNILTSDMGKYPHAELDKTASPHKKDTTRMIKVCCEAPGCGYTVRTTQKWIEVGFPTCPCGSPMNLAE